MSDADLDQKMVYLAYRDVFKDRLAKLRKPKKVRNVVEKHKHHFHHKQLADSMDSDKTCRILGDLLATRLFESESAAMATFPTLFSPRELGNDTALIVKCVEDGPPPDTPMPNGTSLGSAPTIRQHRIDGKSGRIQKPTRATMKPTRPILQVEDGKEAVPKEVFCKGINPSLSNNPSHSINADYDLSLQTERRAKKC
jgi:hypothetical protein